MTREDWRVLWMGVRRWRREHGEFPNLGTNKFAFVVEVCRQRDSCPPVSRVREYLRARHRA